MKENLAQQQIPVSPPPTPVIDTKTKRPWIMLAGLLIILLLFGGYLYLYSSGSFDACLMVLTPARNIKTDECKTFGSSCISKGWKADPSCRKIDETVYTEATRTANWKTYSDKQLLFRYPEDWTIDPVQVFGSRSEVEFKYQKTSAFSLTYFANYNNGTEKPFTTLEEFIGTRDGYVKEILLADQKAKYIVDPGDPGHVIPYEEILFFSPDNKAIISLHYEQSYYDVPKANKILDQILSTFKFIN